MLSMPYRVSAFAIYSTQSAVQQPLNRVTFTKSEQNNNNNEKKNIYFQR